MNSQNPKTWSNNLKEQTRNIIEEMSVFTPEGKIYFKNIDGRKSFLLVSDLVKSNLVLHNCLDDNEYEFETAEALIDSGWVID